MNHPAYASPDTPALPLHLVARGEKRLVGWIEQVQGQGGRIGVCVGAVAMHAWGPWREAA